MKILLPAFLVFIVSISEAQEKVNPVIKEYGGIYPIPEATVTPDPNQEYKIIIDVYGGADNKTEIDRALNNVARMLNLHAVGGVPAEQMDVVLAVHGQSTYSSLTDEAYRAQFGTENPNVGLIKALKDAGVRIALCGQSMRGRGFQSDQLLEEIEVATSMLTTVTHYQNLGYTLLKF